MPHGPHGPPPEINCPQCGMKVNMPHGPHGPHGLHGVPPGQNQGQYQMNKYPQGQYQQEQQYQTAEQYQPYQQYDQGAYQGNYQY